MASFEHKHFARHNVGGVSDVVGIAALSEINYSIRLNEHVKLTPILRDGDTLHCLPIAQPASAH